MVGDRWSVGEKRGGTALNLMVSLEWRSFRDSWRVQMPFSAELKAVA